MWRLCNLKFGLRSACAWLNGKGKWEGGGGGGGGGASCVWDGRTPAGCDTAVITFVLNLNIYIYIYIYIYICSCVIADSCFCLRSKEQPLRSGRSSLINIERIWVAEGLFVCAFEIARWLLNCCCVCSMLFPFLPAWCLLMLLCGGRESLPLLRGRQAASVPSLVMVTMVLRRSPVRGVQVAGLVRTFIADY